MRMKSGKGAGVRRLSFGVMTALWMIAASINVFAAESEKKVVKVAFPQASGINEVYEDGTYGGCTYDWLMEIAKYTGWEYEFITEGDTSEQINLLRNQECDLMGGMYYREEYEEFYSYPKYIMGSNYSLLMYRQDDPTIVSYDLSTLNGKTIGVFKRATAKVERLQEFLMFNDITCNLIYYEDPQEYENCLEKRAVDLMLGTDVYRKAHYNVASMIPAEPYYLVTAKDEPELCAQLSRAMEAIYAANPNFATELYSQYFPDEYINSLTFTEEELTFLRQSPPLRVAVIRDRYPLFFEEDGVPKGIMPETLRLITQETGLQFEYVYADTHQDRIELMQAGKADVIGGFLDDDQAVG